MQALRSAIDKVQPVALKGDGVTSVATLVPVSRPNGYVAFRLVEEQRFLRILQGGRVDLNGGNGPWTEFRVTEDASGALHLQAVKAGLWLAVADGELISASAPAELTPIVDEQAVGPNPAVGSGSGDFHMLRLVSGAATLPWLVRIDRKGAHVLLVTGAGGNVACGPGGHVHDKGGMGKWAQWEMRGEPGGGLQFRNVGHGRYLAFDTHLRPTLADEPSKFLLGEVTAELPQRLPEVDSSVLSKNDLAQFKDLGYLIVRGAVPPELVRDALRSINYQLGKPGCWEVDSNPLNASQLALKLPPDGIGGQLVSKSPILWSAINILLGVGNIDIAATKRGPQIALRFPDPPANGYDRPDVRDGKRYHIDGMGQDRLCPFTLLCGVALSDQSRPNCGNLNIFPGSHLDKDLHQYYLRRLSDETQGEADQSKPDLGAAIQVLLQPGDAVIAHQMLAHRIGQNTSEHIRYQLYYRLLRKDHANYKGRIVDDPWVEFAI